MKKLALLLLAILTSTIASAEENTSRYYATYDGSKYIFVENGIEFSVFPDGEFDFYIPQYVNGVSVGVNAGPLNISFNTGYDYDAYIQYDEYGAIIQVENTPIYYDYYGRITQAGDVFINYRNNRLVQVGGLYVNYNAYGVFDYCTGYINSYNRYYVYRPFHSYFYRPIFNRCLVFTTPYRRYYRPVRYDYVYHRRNYRSRNYYNGRRNFRRPARGAVAHNNGRRTRSISTDEHRRTRNSLAESTPRTNSRGIAQRDDRGTRNDNRPRRDDHTTQRGIAQQGNSRGTRNDNTLKRDDRNTQRGRPQNSTGERIGKRDKNALSRDGRTTQRGIATQQRGTQQKTRGTASRGIAQDRKKSTRSTQRKPAQRPSASKSNKRQTTKARPASSSRSNRTSSANRSQSRPKSTSRSTRSSSSRSKKSPSVKSRRGQ